MPVRRTKAGWFWGSKGPYDSREEAEAVARKTRGKEPMKAKKTTKKKKVGRKSRGGY